MDYMERAREIVGGIDILAEDIAAALKEAYEEGLEAGFNAVPMIALKDQPR